MNPTIPLWQVPRSNWIMLADGTQLFFECTDGMFSHCLTAEGVHVPLMCTTQVTVLGIGIHPQPKEN